MVNPINRPDLITQLSKLNPKPNTEDMDKLMHLSYTMRIEILAMAKEIERLNEQNIDLANRFNLQSQEIEELKSELELERFEEDDSHLYDEDNLTPQPK